VSGQAAVLQAVRVGGEDQALLQFDTDNATLPRLSIDGNRVELTFAGTTLSPELVKTAEFSSPHALVQRLRLDADAQGTVRAKVTVNGSPEKLRDRVRLQKSDGGISLVLNYPAGTGATFKLLQEEQESIAPVKAAAAPVKSGFGWFRLLLIVVLFGATGGASWYFVKAARKKTPWRSSRKHLIETVAQTTVGEARNSVAILRVGTEFVMVGVTSQNISFLSHLPKLASQYEEESSLERESFKDALAEQSRKTTGLNS